MSLQAPILISTYNYYPLNQGGTEAYVIQLIRYLQARGKVCRLIAATDAARIKSVMADCEVLMDTTEGVAVRYVWEGVEVLGIDWKQTRIEDIYTKDKPSWRIFLQKALLAAGWGDFEALYMNGLNGVSGVALVQVLKAQQPDLPIWLWEHTPFSCFKGTLMQQGQMCGVQATISNCKQCVLAERLGSAYRLWPFVPSALKQKLPASLAALEANMAAHFQVLHTLKQYVDKWIYFTDSMTAHLEGLGLMAESRHLQPHGIDTTRFHAHGRTQAPQTRFIYTGRWERIKGFFTLVQAWLALPEQPTQRTLSIAGQSDTQHWTSAQKKQWAALCQRQDVVLLGQLSQSQMPDTYRQHDVVLIPSQWVETGPLVFHEAIACGCSVVASAIGGCASLGQYYTANSQLVQDFQEPGAWTEVVLAYEHRDRAVHSVDSTTVHFEAIFDTV